MNECVETAQVSVTYSEQLNLMAIRRIPGSPGAVYLIA